MPALCLSPGRHSAGARAGTESIPAGTLPVPFNVVPTPKSCRYAWHSLRALCPYDDDDDDDVIRGRCPPPRKDSVVGNAQVFIDVIVG